MENSQNWAEGGRNQFLPTLQLAFKGAQLTLWMSHVGTRAGTSNSPHMKVVIWGEMSQSRCWWDYRSSLSLLHS